VLLIAAALLVAGFGFAVFLQRKRRGSIELAKETATAILPEKPDMAGPSDTSCAALEALPSFEVDSDGVFLSESSQTSLANEPGRIEPSPRQADELESATTRETPTASRLPLEPSVKNVIVVSSEMEAVMQTLTARERAVMSTLIDHGGRMTQADIRYDTGTPKSSLTGILISLERRKLVSKKEWGRTNIIELSDWFLSKKERL
jgi:uncharacterized membrane protein